MKVKAYYKLGDMLLKGYVKDFIPTMQGTVYNFNTPERDKKGLSDILVAADSVRLVF